jgi:hypothetical protein
MLNRGDTHFTKYLADFWTGNEVATCTDDRICRIHIVTFGGMGEAKLHISRKGYGTIGLCEISSEKIGQEYRVMRTLMLSNRIFSTGVTDVASPGPVCDG